MTWRKWLRHFCPFRPPRPPRSLGPVPGAARLDFRHAVTRLTGASLDQVDSADFAERGAVEARDRIRKVGEQSQARTREGPVMRAANEAAEQLARSRSEPADK